MVSLHPIYCTTAAILRVAVVAIVALVVKRAIIAVVAIAAIVMVATAATVALNLRSYTTRNTNSTILLILTRYCGALAMMARPYQVHLDFFNRVLWHSYKG